MIVWGALLIPFIAAIVCCLLFNKKMTLWEYILPAFICILLITVSKGCSETIQTQDEEYWGGYVTQATYEEHWNEYIDETCSRTVSCGKDCTTTETYDCSYVKDHPEEWYFEDTLGDTTYIGPEYFEGLCKKFKNKSFVEMNRHYHNIDGDAYKTVFKGEKDSLYPVSRIHNYENRIQASRSIFKFKEISPKEAKKYKLFSYPRISSDGQTETILGAAGNQKQQAEKYLQYLNSVYGHSKQVRLFILIFQDQPFDAAMMQESYWMGGNKNEFILCIGINKKREVRWSHIISWTEQEQLKINTRQEILKQKGKKLNLIPIIRYLEITIPKEFKRKEFKEFSYLTVEPPVGAVIAIYLLVLITTVGINLWSIENEFNAIDFWNSIFRKNQ